MVCLRIKQSRMLAKRSRHAPSLVLDGVRRDDRVAKARIMANDMTLNGCTTTHIFCRPNCPPGRRTKPLHRVHFASLEAAFAAGFRPCKVCQPLDGPPGPWRPRRERTA